MADRNDFLLGKAEIRAGLERLGKLAKARRLQVKLALVGGAVMVLKYNARASTHDVDAIVLAPSDRRQVFELAKIVAQEKGWPEDWLNDDAEQFVRALNSQRLFSADGVEVHTPATAQMLALKLSAWRSELDMQDAACLLRNLRNEISGGRKDVWRAVRPFLMRGYEATAEDAFNDSWNDLYGYD